MVSNATPAPNGGRQGPRIIPELDGVRGLAILLVLFYHFKGRPPEVLPVAVYAPLMIGWSGVDLFFCLSGFLITGILIDSKGARNYFSSFYARRVLRIFPLYISAVVVYFHVIMPVAHYLGYWPYNNHSLEIWYWLHLSNWRSAFGLDQALLSHFWSLAIEEQFYVVWPLVIFLVPRSWLGAVCAALSVLPLVLRCVYADTPVVELLHRLTPFRIDTLALGGLAAVVVRDPRWKVVVARYVYWTGGGAAVLIAVVLAAAGTTDSGAPLVATFGYSGFAVFYTCFIFVAYVNSGSSGWLATQLRRPALRAFGKYSYGIYVLHNPLAYYMGDIATRIEKQVSSPIQVVIWLSAMALGLLLSYGMAVVSWRLIEKRFIEMKGRFSVRTVLAAP